MADDVRPREGDEQEVSSSGLLLSVDPLQGAPAYKLSGDDSDTSDILGGDSDASDADGTDAGGDSDGTDTGDSDGSDSGDSDSTDDGSDADGTDISDADGTDTGLDADGMDPLGIAPQNADSRDADGT